MLDGQNVYENMIDNDLQTGTLGNYYFFKTFTHLSPYILSLTHSYCFMMMRWNIWKFIVQTTDEVTEVNGKWDYLAGLLPIRTYIPVSPGPGPYSTCWPFGLILPLKSEVIAPDDTPIVASVVSGCTVTCRRAYTLSQ